MILPTIIDYGSDQDAGFWLACRPFVHFPWIDFEPVHDAAREHTDALASEPLFLSNHAWEIDRG